jgi:hypothetical protein
MTRILPAQKRALLLRFAIGSPIYAMGIGLAFVSARLSLLVYAALAVYYLLEPVPSEIGQPREHPASDIEVKST